MSGPTQQLFVRVLMGIYHQILRSLMFPERVVAQDHIFTVLFFIILSYNQLFRTLSLRAFVVEVKGEGKRKSTETRRG